MARYIDAELLEAALFTPHIYDINRDDVIALVAEQPTADVVETTKAVEMICKTKTNIIKNVSTMIENDFSEIVKDALG